MQNLQHSISIKLIELVKREYSLDIDYETAVLEKPKKEEWGDLASTVALKISSKAGHSPADIAKKLCFLLNNEEFTFTFNDVVYPIFEKIDFAFPGFINFKFSVPYLLNYALELSSKGLNVKDQKRPNISLKIALEHSNVNPNKAAHVGHLRNACIGQFIERVYEKMGHDVNVQYYEDDLGVQVSTSLMGTMELKDINPSDYEKFDHYAWDVYAKMESLIVQDENLQKKREHLMQRLEDSKDEISVEQSKLADRILKDQLVTFGKLDFDYDVIIREKDIVSLGLWNRAFEKLKTNPNVYLATSGPSKGCWMINMSGDKNEDAGSLISDSENQEEISVQEPLGGGRVIEEDKVIVRSNGVPTYTGKDIAYHMWKYGLLGLDFYYRELDIGTQKKILWTTSSEESDISKDVSFSKNDYVIDVIDVKQTYAIDVVRASLSYLGYTSEAENMTHVNYGFVYLSPKTAEKMGIDTSDGKTQYAMSGRKGWGIKVDDLIEMVDSKLRAEYGDFKNVNDVRNGAIKFEMLRYNTFQDIVFDLDAALSLNGFSGPYIQYTHARTFSILEKGAFQEIDFYSLPTSLHEREVAVLAQLAKFSSVVLEAAYEFAPNNLCNYLFELAQKYNTFYNELPILSSPQEEKK